MSAIMDDNDRIAELERRLETMGKRIDDLAERAGQRIDPSFPRRPPQSNVRSFWGSIFILIGLIWLANRMGWFYVDIPIAAPVLIALGLYMIVSSRR